MSSIQDVLIQAARGYSPWKGTVRVATTTNVTRSGLITVDGVTVQAGDLVLDKNASNPAQRGIYVVAVGAWSRAVDSALNQYVTSGSTVYVSEGATNGEKYFTLTTPDPIVLDITSQVWEEKIGAGGGGGGTSPLLNVKDFGAVGDGVTDDSSAFEDVIAEAKALNTSLGTAITVFVPAGIYPITVNTSTANILECDLDIIWQGEGMDASRLHISTSGDPTAAWYYGLVCTNGHDMTVNDLAITCEDAIFGQSYPATAGTAGPNQAIRHNGGNLGGNLTVSRCKFNGPNGGWFTPVDHEATDGATIVSDCLINGGAGAIASWGGDGGGGTYDKEVIVTNCRFHTYYNGAHSVYTHPVCARRIHACYSGPSEEYQTARNTFAFYTNAGDIGGRNKPAKYAQISNCTVVGDLGQAVRSYYSAEPEDADALRTSTATTTGNLTGQTFNGTRAADTWQARRVLVTRAEVGGAYVNGSTMTIYGEDSSGASINSVITFSGTDGGDQYLTDKIFASVATYDIQAQATTGGSYTIGLEQGPTGTVSLENVRALGCGGLLWTATDATVTGCVVDNYQDLQSGSGILCMIQNDEPSELHINVSGSTFRCYGNVLYVGTANLTRTVNWNVNGCHLEGTCGTATIISSFTSDPGGEIHNFLLTGCRLIGNNGTYLGTSNNNLTFRSCDFVSGTAGTFRPIIGGDNVAVDCKFTFENCTCDSNERIVNFNGYGSVNLTIAGGENDFSLVPSTGRFFHPTPANVTAGLRPRRGLSPTDMGSASEMVFGWDYDTYRVTGTTTMDYLYMNHGTDATPFMNGRIYIIFVSTAATSNTGNILPLSTGARTAGEVACFQYDPTADKWREI